ncbi:MAG: hypothetical protein ACRDKL_02665, partial [Solirubrobacteraceae bacterium]
MSSYVYLVLGAIFAGVAVLALLPSRRSRGQATVERVHTAIDYGARGGLVTGDTDVSAYLDNEPKRSPLSVIATGLGNLFS